MPTKHYRRALKTTANSYMRTNTTFYITSTAPATPTTTTSITETTNSLSFFNDVQQYLLQTMDVIQQNLDITEVTQYTTIIFEKLSPKYKLFKAIEHIQCTIYSIIENIAELVDFHIINSRIMYLNSLIYDLPEDFRQTYNEVGVIILQVLNAIAANIDITIIQQQFKQINDLLHDDIKYINKMEEIHETILGIVQNMADGIDINIINRRIQYLIELINDINC
jgi:hypothetical protein